MLAGQGIVVGATVGASAMMMVSQAVQGESGPSIGVQGALLGAGIALFVFFDRRERSAAERRRQERADAERERNMERRVADEAKDKRLRELEERVEYLTQRLFDALGGGRRGADS
jgi:hypothetical protein